MLIMLALALAGCAVKAPVQAPEDYPVLTLSADEPNTLLFTKPDMNLGGFDRVHVAPVVILIIGEAQTTKVTTDDAQGIGMHAEAALREQLGRYFERVDKSAADALGVYFRITELEPTSAAQVAMMVPPFSLVNMLSPKGLFLGSITISGEIYEGLAEQPSVAFPATRSRPGIDATAAFGRWTVAEKVLEQAAERLATDLDAERRKLREGPGGVFPKGLPILSAQKRGPAWRSDADSADPPPTYGARSSTCSTLSKGIPASRFTRSTTAASAASKRQVQRQSPG